MTLFRNRVIEDVISKDEITLEQDSPRIQYDRCPYRRGECGHKRGDRERRRPRENRGRDGRDASAGQGTLGAPETARDRKGPLPEPLSEYGPASTLNSGFWPEA